MASKHAAKHTRQNIAIKLIPIVVALAVIVVVVGLAVSKRPSSKDGATDNKPILEILKDGDQPDANEPEDQEMINDWSNRLNDEQKAELEIAYETSVADGYTGTMDDWIAAEVQARATGSGNVVITLPDGGEFTVERNTAPQGDHDSDEDAAGTSDDEGQSPDGQEDNTADPSQNDMQSALLAVDTVVAHKGDKRVALPIKILGNPGTLGLTFSVSYDESAMTLVGTENGKAFEGVLVLTHSRTYASGCLFTWDGVDIKPDQVKDGAVLTLFFDVANDAAGLHSVAVRGASAFDADLGSISLTTQDGSIVIE